MLNMNRATLVGHAGKDPEIRDLKNGGKAAVDYWVAVVKPGRIMFEVAGVPQDDAVEALRLAAQKLPLATKTVFRDRLATAASNAAVA